MRDFQHEGEDILLLCGDIGINDQGMKFANKVARIFDIPVLMIAGNHEFYQNWKSRDHTWENTLDNLRKAAGHTSKVVKGETTYLEDTVVEYEGVRFIGATLWTDMKLYGDDPMVAWKVSRALNDYRVIISEEDPLCPMTLTTDQTVYRHGVSRQFIETELAKPFEGPTVVMTHHTPSQLSIPEHYREDKVSAGYTSRLESVIEQYQPTVWCHGHTHTSFDYKIGETRVICNPRGYAEIDPNLDFKVDLIVEV